VVCSIHSWFWCFCSTLLWLSLVRY
jgi:hypothetical protein